MSELARRYAQALYEVMPDETGLRATAEALMGQSELWAALCAPTVRAEEKKRLLGRLPELDGHGTLLRFYRLLAEKDRMALLRVLLPMEKAKREQLLPALQQLRACICGALTQRGGLDTASESAAQIVASRSGSELLQASDSIQAAIDALAANASAGAVTGYLAMKLR